MVVGQQWASFISSRDAGPWMSFRHVEAGHSVTKSYFSALGHAKQRPRHKQDGGRPFIDAIRLFRPISPLVFAHLLAGSVHLWLAEQILLVLHINRELFPQVDAPS